MRAKYITKLRKRINNYEQFEVSLTLGLFGFPYGNWKRVILAKNAIHAVKRYIKCYVRYFKRRPIDYSHSIIETTEVWGRFRVIDANGSRIYYKWD